MPGARSPHSGRHRPAPDEGSSGGRPRASAGVGRRRPGQARAFELLESKLAAPHLRPELVFREQPVEVLRSSGARIVSIAAPAGYGKTTTLAQWALHDPRAVAWVTLDRRDDDPVVLLTYIAAAFDRVEQLDPAVFRAVAAAGTAMWTTSVPRLGATLMTAARPFVLVLDDVDELESRDCLDALAALADHIPEGSRLVLASRGEAPLPLARMRVEGRLLELGPPELAMSDDEAHLLVSGVGLELSRAATAALNSRTEGWPAGLYLAALSVDATADPARASDFDGTDRFVTDYVRSELLSRLDTETVRFLTRTSVLDRLSGPLCDAVLERDDSAEILESIESANLFVVPLDQVRGWYRYHRLFRGALRAELDRREPKLVAELNLRASSWCAANGLLPAAIDYAAAAANIGEVARLVGIAAFPTYRSGRVATVEGWLEAFDDPERLAHYPALATFGAFIHALRGRPAAAGRWAAAIERSVHAGPMPDGSPASSWAAMVRALLCRHGIEQMRADAEIAIAELTAASPWRAVAVLFAGVAALLDGDEERATPLLVEAGETAGSTGAAFAGVVAHAELALLALERGDLADAEREIVAGSDFVEDAWLTDYAPTALLLAARARVALRRGERDAAQHDLLLAHRLRPQLTTALSWYAVQSSLELARVHLALADPDGARTLQLESREILRQRPHLGVLPAQVEEIGAQLAAVTAPSAGWASTLTAAELRLLPLLTTHLSFREIGERLYVSRNTVKTQAISVYRKLNASSRSEAIARAAELGLVDAVFAAPTAADFTPAG